MTKKKGGAVAVAEAVAEAGAVAGAVAVRLSPESGVEPVKLTLPNSIDGFPLPTTGLGVLASLSFYAPIFITVSIMLFSLFSSAIGKGLFYLFWIFVSTAVRIIIMYALKDDKKGNGNGKGNDICSNGVYLPFITSTYSVFILSFTLCYFLIPMIILGFSNKGLTINYGVIGFFIAYMMLDIMTKLGAGCIDDVFSGPVMYDLLAGSVLGAVISGTINATKLNSMLFINEMLSNNQVCSKPSKQQFKCSVYKNGEIVSSSVN